MFQSLQNNLASPNMSRIYSWESAKASHKRVFALFTPEIPHLEMAQMLQKPVFVLPGCQPMSVNTLLCDTLGLAEFNMSLQSRSCDPESFGKGSGASALPRIVRTRSKRC